MTVHRVLCVDDDAQLLAGLERSLRKVCPVVTANGGPAALERLRVDRDFAVIISDMRMPEMNGAQFLAEARLLAPLAMRVLLTGEADLEAVGEAVNAGHIHFYLRKPLEREELTQLVQRAFVAHIDLVEALGRAQVTVRAGVGLALAVLGARDPEAASHAARAGALAVRLGERLGLHDVAALELATQVSIIGKHLPPGNARALVAQLFQAKDGFGGVHQTVLELWDADGATRLSASASVVQAALLVTELRRGELSEAEIDARLLAAVDPRILDALQELPRAA